MNAGCAGKTEIPWEHVPYLSALEVCSRRGAIQIHVYLYLTSTRRQLSDFLAVGMHVRCACIHPKERTDKALMIDWLHFAAICMAENSTPVYNAIACSFRWKSVYYNRIFTICSYCWLHCSSVGVWAKNCEALCLADDERQQLNVFIDQLYSDMDDG